ncbi:MAG: class I tRNA ligase family protein, partial [Candidatus Hadarchaeales archaeon]
MDFRERERKWQEEWEKAGIFQAEPDGRPKFYLTVAYPYVSGPMHIGHARTYTIPDVIARYKRMRGYNVLF